MSQDEGAVTYLGIASDFSAVDSTFLENTAASSGGVASVLASSRLAATRSSFLGNTALSVRKKRSLRLTWTSAA